MIILVNNLKKKYKKSFQNNLKLLITECRFFLLYTYYFLIKKKKEWYILSNPWPYQIYIEIIIPSLYYQFKTVASL